MCASIQRARLGLSRASLPADSPPPCRRLQGTDREILRLAVPAFGALIAEPLFLLADSAIVGHLGVAELAGVGLASAVLHTVVGLMVFLAYSTTPAVARAIGNGQLAKALAAGRDGVWLALLLGTRPGGRRVPGRRAAPGTDGRPRRGAWVCRGLPALVHARPRGDAAHLRGHRGAARTAGHPDPADRRRRRFHAEHRAEPRPRLRAGLVRDRLGRRHEHRAVGHGGRLCADRPAQRPHQRGVPAAGLARHPGPDAGWAPG